MFSHLSIIFIHFQGFLQKFLHFCNDRFRRKNFYPSSKSGNPRKESGADFDGGGNGEMLGIHRKHLDVLAELVNDGIGKLIAEADANIASRAPIHIKHLCLLACDVLLLIKLSTLSGHCQRLTDALHPVHSVIAELFSVVGVKIVAAVVPKKGVGTDNQLLTVLHIVFSVSLGGGILSFLVMALLKKGNHLGCISVSVAGGIAHNIGQILIAALVVSSHYVLYYFPVLLIAG